MTASGAGLARINTAVDTDALRVALTECCAATAWVDGVVAGRPYADAEALYTVSDDATLALDATGFDQALAGHPRIGAQASGQGRHTAWSRQEQSGMAGADDDERAQLAAANVAYEQRFGHVYLVCATGLSAAELLAKCTARLQNDPETERGVVLTELAKINRIRLAKLLDAEVGR